MKDTWTVTTVQSYIKLPVDSKLFAIFCHLAYDGGVSANNNNTYINTMSNKSKFTTSQTNSID